MTEDTSRENSGMYEMVSDIYKKKLETVVEEVGYVDLKQEAMDRRQKVGLFGKIGKKLDSKIDYDNGFFLFLAGSLVVIWALITVIPLLLLNPFVAIWNALFGGKSKIDVAKKKAIELAKASTVEELAQRFGNFEKVSATNARLAANYFFNKNSSSFYIYGPH